MRRHLALLGITALAALPLAAQAEGAVGGSAAWARLNGSDFADDGSNMGWKAFIGGYSQIVGGEVQYIDFGHPGNYGSRLHAYTADLTGGWHFGGFYPYGKFGAAFVDVKHQNVHQEITSQTNDYHTTRAFWGVGARFPIVPAFGLRVEYERFQLRGEHEDLASAGAEFRF